MTDLERDIRRFLIPVLRRASLRWKPRNEALKAARVDRGLYKCASCQELFGPKDIVLDHIEPVVPLTGDTYSWHDFVNRLFVSSEKYQVLCHPCHDTKSLIEDNIRASFREKERTEEKERKKEEKLQKKLAKQKKKD